jgi:hypothetical protein
MTCTVAHNLYSGLSPAVHDLNSGQCPAKWPMICALPVICTAAYVQHGGPWPVQWPMKCTTAYLLYMSCTVANTEAHDLKSGLCPAQWPMYCTVAHDLYSGPWPARAQWPMTCTACTVPMSPGPAHWQITHTVGHDLNIKQAPLLDSETLWNSISKFPI